MISSHSKAFLSLNKSPSSSNSKAAPKNVVTNFVLHQQWSTQGGWKTTLNNFRLIIQPIILLWLIVPWLEVFPSRYLLLGFHKLITLMNQFYPYFPDG